MANQSDTALPKCRSRRHTPWPSRTMTSPRWRTTIMLRLSESSPSQSTATYRYHPPAHAIMPNLAAIAWSHSQTALCTICLMHKRDIHCGQTSWAGDFGVAVMRLPHVSMQDCLPMRAACSDVCIHALMCAYISTSNAVAARMICAAEMLDEVMAHRPCMARSCNLCPSAVTWPFCLNSLNLACNEQHVDRYLS